MHFLIFIRAKSTEHFFLINSQISNFEYQTRTFYKKIARTLRLANVNQFGKGLSVHQILTL